MSESTKDHSKPENERANGAADPLRPRPSTARGNDVIEEFKGKGLRLVCAKGEGSIPHDGASLEEFSHVDVRIVEGEVPERFRVYFEDGRAKCLHVRIYTQMKQSVAIPAEPKAS